MHVSAGSNGEGERKAGAAGGGNWNWRDQMADTGDGDPKVCVRLH